MEKMQARFLPDVVRMMEQLKGASEKTSVNESITRSTPLV
jgi:hypothetical protein